MRVILDTNVFISGIFFSGPPYKVLRAWQDKKIRIVASPAILIISPRQFMEKYL